MCDLACIVLSLSSLSLSVWPCLLASSACHTSYILLLLLLYKKSYLLKIKIFGNVYISRSARGRFSKVVPPWNEFALSLFDLQWFKEFQRCLIDARNLCYAKTEKNNLFVVVL